MRRDLTEKELKLLKELPGKHYFLLSKAFQGMPLIKDSKERVLNLKIGHNTCLALRKRFSLPAFIAM